MVKGELLCDKINDPLIFKLSSPFRFACMQVLPPLGALIGSGKPLNCLVTNKWRNLAEIGRLTDMPLLLLASVRVSDVLHKAQAACGVGGGAFLIYIIFIIILLLVYFFNLINLIQCPF